jgi:hypothetical protein
VLGRTIVGCLSVVSSGSGPWPAWPGSVFDSGVVVLQGFVEQVTFARLGSVITTLVAAGRYAGSRLANPAAVRSVR